VTRVVVVTGAGSGIGRATALEFARQGDQVACLDLNVESAQETVAMINRESFAPEATKSKAWQLDVANTDEVTQVIGQVVQDLGPIQVCCNVAGIGKFARSETQPVAEFRKILEVNLVGAFAVSQACLPSLLETQGCIVNVSSSAGLLGQPYNAAYSASKGGVSLMTRSMAVEYVRRGVRVNAVAPAGIDTPITDNFDFLEGTHPREYAKMMPPSGKMGTPEQVASLIAYLASPAAAYISGTIVPIDMTVTA
jgi:NAD(P)-dependent dehydrogenase (short-subunit alcohol dehydrogenase family)